MIISEATQAGLLESGEVWFATIVASVSSAAVSIIFQYFANKKANAHQNELTRALETYKNELKVNSDNEMEKLRNKLRLDSSLREKRFSTMHERQAEIIAQIYSLLDSTADAIADDIVRNQHPSPERIKPLHQYYKSRRIYIPMKTLLKLETMVAEMDRIAEEFIPNTNRSIEDGMAAAEAFIVPVNDLMFDLHKDFQKLLGVEE